ncbi:MAG: deoxyribonuclease V [Armatimonadetes bacterium]|nr:deoxyribonuclease V [Armatimonadota bacterium]MDW8121528.1 deoxyribonuclease V [Armatimonadota bacterium]
MRLPKGIRWDLSVDEAMRVQTELSKKVIEEDYLPDTIRLVGGADVHQVGPEQMLAVVCVVSLPALTLVEVSKAVTDIVFPYIPGLLAFRELPAVLKAMESLKSDPDVLLCDAHGRAHPRRFGLASHIGVLLDKPSIGCAKSRLYGHAREPEDAPGEWTELTDPRDHTVIGAVVRTQKSSPPLYVSVGHRISLPTAVKFVQDCCKGHRLPEPLRLAHEIARQSVRAPRRLTQERLF